MADLEFRASINKRKLRFNHTLDDVIDGMTIWAELGENDSKTGKDTEPLLKDENGRTLTREQAREAVSKGIGVFVIENNPEDEIALTAFVKKDPKTGDVFSSNSLETKRENMTTEMKKPGLFKRMIHGMFSGAFKEVGEYNNWRKERDASVERLKADRTANYANGLSPQVSVRSQSSSRAFLVNERKKSASKLERNAVNKAPGHAFTLSSEEEKQFLSMNTQKQAAVISAHAEGYIYLAGNEIGKANLSKAYPGIQGKEDFLEGPKGEYLKKMLENGIKARSSIYSGILGSGADNSADRDLANVFMGRYIEKLIAEKDTNPEALKRLEWLSVPQNSELLFRNFSVQFERSMPGIRCFKELDLEQNVAKNLATVERICGDCMNGIHDEKAFQTFFKRNANLGGLNKPLPGDASIKQYENTFAIPGSPAPAPVQGNEHKEQQAEVKDEPSTEEITASIKAKAQEEQKSPKNADTTKERAKEQTKQTVKSSQKPEKLQDVKTKTVRKAQARHIVNRKQKIKAVKKGTNSKQKQTSTAVGK